MTVAGIVKRIVLKSKREVEVQFKGMYESGDLPLFDEGISDVKLGEKPIEECLLNHVNLFTHNVEKADFRPFIRASVKLHRAKSKEIPRPVHIDVTLSIRAADQDRAVELLSHIGATVGREGSTLDLELGEGS